MQILRDLAKDWESLVCCNNLGWRHQLCMAASLRPPWDIAIDFHPSPALLLSVAIAQVEAIFCLSSFALLLHGAKTKRGPLDTFCLLFWGKYCRLSCALCTVGSVLPGGLVRYSSAWGWWHAMMHISCQATEAQLVAEKDLQVGIQNPVFESKNDGGYCYWYWVNMTELLL